MGILRPMTGLLALALAAALSAAELTAVPVDLARYLSGGGRILREPPADFPEFTLPEGVRVMGAYDDLERRQLVLLSSLSGAAQAQQAIVDDLLARGWVDMSAAERDRPYGFIVPAVELAPAYLCHDELGNLSVRGEDGVENRVYLQRIVRTPNIGVGPSCAEAAAASAAGQYLSPTSNTSRYLPNLQPPDAGADAPRLARIVDVGFSSSGGNSQLNTEVGASAPDFSAAELGEHYAAQLRAQGWSLDSAWGLEARAGSHWTRRSDEGNRLLLSLLIRSRTPDSYSTAIRLLELAGAD